MSDQNKLKKLSQLNFENNYNTFIGKDNLLFCENPFFIGTYHGGLIK